MEETAKEQADRMGCSTGQSPPQVLPTGPPSWCFGHERQELALATLSQGNITRGSGLADAVTNRRTDMKSCPKGEGLKRSGWQWGCPIEFRALPTGGTWVCCVLGSPRRQGQDQQGRPRKTFLTSSDTGAPKQQLQSVGAVSEVCQGARGQAAGGHGEDGPLERTRTARQPPLPRVVVSQLPIVDYSAHCHVSMTSSPTPRGPGRTLSHGAHLPPGRASDRALESGGARVW